MFFNRLDLRKNTRRKKNKATNIETARPYFNKKILKDEESFWQPQATDNGRGGKTKIQRGTSEFKMKCKFINDCAPFLVCLAVCQSCLRHITKKPLIPTTSISNIIQMNFVRQLKAKT